MGPCLGSYNSGKGSGSSFSNLNLKGTFKQQKSNILDTTFESTLSCVHPSFKRKIPPRRNVSFIHKHVRNQINFQFKFKVKYYLYLFKNIKLSGLLGNFYIYPTCLHSLLKFSFVFNFLNIFNFLLRVH